MVHKVSTVSMVLDRRERMKASSGRDGFTVPGRRVTPKQGTAKEGKPPPTCQQNLTGGEHCKHSAGQPAESRSCFSQHSSPDSLAGDTRDLHQAHTVCFL